jgi:transcriptional regulator with XRE-family HTH domain
LALSNLLRYVLVDWVRLMGNPFFRRYRDKHGLSRKDLAKLLGVTEGAIGHYERGVRSVTAKKAQEWSGVLGVLPAEILFPEPDVPQESAA